MICSRNWMTLSKSNGEKKLVETTFEVLLKSNIVVTFKVEGIDRNITF
jgi:hypothetical protein